MYKVLLVDDERIIVEGISQMLDWTSFGTQLIGTARNGLEAVSLIEENPPDIVISDIKMPGMDGLQLVQWLHEHYPQTSIILLSGFSEFDYARKALQFGVKHYLLKPCNEQTIIDALCEIVEQRNQVASSQDFVSRLQTELSKVMPHAKEQFLKELVTNKTYGSRDWEEYARLFHLELSGEELRLILFQIKGDFEFEHLFAVKNIAQDMLESDMLLLGTTIGTHVLLLIKDDGDFQTLLGSLDGIKQAFSRYYKLDVTIAVSRSQKITQSRSMYKETLSYLNHQFYLGEGSIITSEDISNESEDGGSSFSFDEDQLGMHIRSGDWELAKSELTSYFEQLAESRIAMQLVKSYAISLYISIARQCVTLDDHGRYLGKLTLFEEAGTLRAIEQIIMENAEAICMAHYRQFRNRHSDIIRRMLQIVEEQLGNPNLSLGWVAGEILYMNADYLGKLFKKETGDKFSNYVMKLRIERAKQTIEQGEDVKVFQLAEKFGFGDNPQYFSQVFKKIAGCTPSEYRRTP